MCLGAPKKYGGVKDVVDVHQGSNVLLEYFTIADPAPTVQWFFNNQPLDVVLNTDKYNVTLTSSQPHCYVVTNSTLEIFDIQIQEIGNYTCQATNIHGNETSTFQLQLKGKQIITWKSKDTVTYTLILKISQVVVWLSRLSYRVSVMTVLTLFLTGPK